jgi:ubiquinone/menaquinone biosynthesis C-methylase UbiE
MRRRDARTTVVALADLDAVLAEAARRFEVSEDDGRAYLLGFRVMPPRRPADPFSDAYRAWVFDLYRAVSLRDGYAVDHESSPFDFDAAVVRPHPFATGSATVVGDDRSARGAVVKALGLAAPARVVEFGAGWGNLTSDLATMGHDVTAVEVDAGFCRLIERRVPAARVVKADMLSFAREPDGGPYDAAVFYESFHHCADHLAMLGHLHDVVTPGGVVVMGAEPVDVLAYPWGLRLDGLSLWSTRRYGWLELGFDERYFAAAMARTGWAVEEAGERRAAPPTFVARSTSLPAAGRQ